MLLAHDTCVRRDERFTVNLDFMDKRFCGQLGSLPIAQKKFKEAVMLGVKFPGPSFEKNRRAVS